MQLMMWHKKITLNSSLASCSKRPMLSVKNANSVNLSAILASLARRNSAAMRMILPSFESLKRMIISPDWSLFDMVSRETWT